MTPTTDTTKKDDLPSPIEVWVTAPYQPGEAPTIRLYGPGEAEIETDGQFKELGWQVSLSVRGAEREVTAKLVALGYTPVGRWGTEVQDHDEPAEASRAFRLAEELSLDRGKLDQDKLG